MLRARDLVRARESLGSGRGAGGATNAKKPGAAPAATPLGAAVAMALGDMTSSVAPYTVSSRLLDGDPWAGAVATVAGAEAPPPPEYELDLATRMRFLGESADARHLLGSGVKEEGPDKTITTQRLLKELLGKLAPLPATTLATHDRVLVMERLAEVSKAERLAAGATATMHARMRPSVPGVDDAGALKELVLEALTHVAEAAAAAETPAAAGATAVAAVASVDASPLVAEVGEMLNSLKPNTLYSQWSPAPLAREALLKRAHLHPRRFLASSKSLGVDAEAAAAAMVDAGYALAAVPADDATAAATTRRRRGGGGVHDRGAVATGKYIAGRLGVSAASAGGGVPTATTATDVWRSDKHTNYERTAPAPGPVLGFWFASAVPVSSIKLFWGGAPPAEVAVEVTTDPLPDPLAHATRVSTRLAELAPRDPAASASGGLETPPGDVPGALLLFAGNQTAEAAAAAAASIVLSTPVDASGDGVASTSSVAEEVLPPDAREATQADGSIVRGAVTWRRVYSATVSATGEGLHEYTHVPVGASRDPASCSAVTGLRVMLARRHRVNPHEFVALPAIQFLVPVGSPEAAGAEEEQAAALAAGGAGITASASAGGDTFALMQAAAAAASAAASGGASGATSPHGPLHVVSALQTWLHGVALAQRTAPAAAGSAAVAAAAAAAATGIRAGVVPASDDKASQLESSALIASLRLALASGSQAALLKYCAALLGLPVPTTGADPAAALAAGTEALLADATAAPPASAAALTLADVTDGWGSVLRPAHRSIVHSSLEALAGARHESVKRFFGRNILRDAAGASGSGGPGDTGTSIELKWDASNSSHTNGTAMRVSSDGRSVSDASSGEGLAVTTVGFKGGLVEWTFRLERDSSNDEHSCMGCTLRPITTRSYGSIGSNGCLIRSYNGELYGSYKSGSARAKVHQGDRVKYVFDGDAGTIKVFVNDADQGVCFTGLQGKTLYPAMSVYGSGVTVTLMTCEVFRTTVVVGNASVATSAADAAAAEKAAKSKSGATEADLDAIATAAVAAMDSGADAVAAAAAVASTAIALPAAAGGGKAGAASGGASAEVLDPKPVAPKLAEADDEGATMCKPNVAMLVDMGFHWAMAAAALRETGDNLDQAADRLLTGSISSGIVDATEGRVNAYHAAKATFDAELREWEQRQAERKRAEEEAKAAAASGGAKAGGAAGAGGKKAAAGGAAAATAAGSAHPLGRAASAGLDDDPEALTAAAAELRMPKPFTRIEAVGALLTLLQDLASAYHPGLVVGRAQPVLPAATAAAGGAATPGTAGAAAGAAAAARARGGGAAGGSSGRADDKKVSFAPSHAGGASGKGGAGAASSTSGAPASGGAAAGAPTSEAAAHMQAMIARAASTSVTSQLQAMDLEEPHCALQVSADNVTALACLLHGFLQALALAQRARKVAAAAAAFGGAAVRTTSADGAWDAPLSEKDLKSLCYKYRELCLITLRLLRATLRRLVQANVSSAEAGIRDARATFAPLHAGIDALLSCADAAVYDGGLQLEAVRTVDSGLTVLYASAEQRAELLGGLIQRHLASTGRKGGAAASGGAVSAAQAELLARCLRYFSSPRGVVALLPPLASGGKATSTTDTSDIIMLLESLMRIAVQSSLKRLAATGGADDADDDGAASAGGVDLARHCVSLLAAFQRHLVALAKDECDAAAARVRAGRVTGETAAANAGAAASTTDGRRTLDDNAVTLATACPPLLDVKLAGAQWAPGASPAGTPAIRLLQAYAAMALCQCYGVLEAASTTAGLQAATIAGGNGTLALAGVDHNLCVDVDAAVRFSPVGTLLAPLVAALATVAAEPSVAVPLLPPLLALAAKHDELAGSLLAIRTAVAWAWYNASGRAVAAAARAPAPRVPVGQHPMTAIHRAVLAQTLQAPCAVPLQQSGLRCVPPPLRSGSWKASPVSPTDGDHVHVTGSVAVCGEQAPTGMWLKQVSSAVLTPAATTGEGVMMVTGSTLAAMLASAGYVLPRLANNGTGAASSTAHDEVAGASDVGTLLNVAGASHLPPVSVPFTVTGTWLPAKSYTGKPPSPGSLKLELHLMLPVPPGFVSEASAAAALAAGAKPKPTIAASPAAAAPAAAASDDGWSTVTTKRGGGGRTGSGAAGPAADEDSKVDDAPTAEVGQFITAVVAASVYLQGTVNVDGIVGLKSGVSEEAVAETVASESAGAAGASAAAGRARAAAPAAGAASAASGAAASGAGIARASSLSLTAVGADGGAGAATAAGAADAATLRATRVSAGYAVVGTGILTGASTKADSASISSQWKDVGAAIDAGVVNGLGALAARKGRTQIGTGEGHLASRDAAVARNVAGQSWSAQLLRLIAATAGRMAAACVTGPHVSYEEEEVGPLLRYEPFAAGVVAAGGSAGDVNSIVPASFAAALKAAKRSLQQRAAPSGATDGTDATGAATAVAPDVAWARSFVAGGFSLGSAGAALHEWLNAQIKEKGLRGRTKAATFPDIETTLALAILMHSGHLAHARAASAALASAVDGASASAAPVFTPELRAAWMRARALRAYLRDAEKTFASGAAIGTVDAAAAAAAAGAADGLGAAAKRAISVVLPRTFPAMLEDVRARLAFVVLQLEPTAASAAAPSAAASGATPTAATAPPPLAPTLSRVRSSEMGGVLPRSAPLLSRSSSSIDRKALAYSDLASKWSVTLDATDEMEGVLLRRNDSEAGGGGDDGDAEFGTGAAGADAPAAAAVWSPRGTTTTASMPTPNTAVAATTATVPVAVAAGVPVPPPGMLGARRPAPLGRQVSLDRADDDEEPAASGTAAAAPAADDATAVEASGVSRVLTDYVRTGMGGPPALLARLLHWRSVRAQARAFGLHAFAALLSAVSSLRSCGVADTGLIALRPALRCRYERTDAAAGAAAAGANATAGAAGSDATAAAAAKAADEVVLDQHSALANLEGAAPAALTGTKVAYGAALAALSEALADAFRARDLQAASVCMWSLGLHSSRKDHEVLHSVGIVPTLEAATGLQSLVLDRKDDEGEPGAKGVTWVPWSYRSITRRLLSGTLAKADVLAHMLAGTKSARDLLAARGLPVDPVAAAPLLSIAETVELYVTQTAAVAAAPAGGSGTTAGAASAAKASSATLNVASLASSMMQELVASGFVGADDVAPAPAGGAGAAPKSLDTGSPVPVRPIAVLRDVAASLFRLLIVSTVAAAGDEHDTAEGASALAASPAGGKVPAASPPAGGKPSGSPGAAAAFQLMQSSSLSLHGEVFRAVRHQLRACASALQAAMAPTTSAAAAPAASADVSSTAGAAFQTARSAELAESEALGTLLLEMLFAICDTPAAKLHASSAPFVTELLHVFAAGSPRMQRLVLVILRSMLTRIEPQDLERAVRAVWPHAVVREWESLAAAPNAVTGADDAAAGSSTSPAATAQPRAFVGWLLDIIASPSVAACRPLPRLASDTSTLVDGDATPPLDAAAGEHSDAASFFSVLSRGHAGDFLANACGLQGHMAGHRKYVPVVGAGAIAQAVASEAVCLARACLGIVQWRSALRPTLEDGVITASSLLAPPGLPSAAAAGGAGAGVTVFSDECTRVVGSLAILGGHVETLRPGARVRLAPFHIAHGKKDASDSKSDADDSGDAKADALTALGDVFATVVRYRLGDHRVKVVFNSDLGSTPASVPIGRLVPVQAVEPPAAALVFGPEIVDSFKAILQRGAALCGATSDVASLHGMATNALMASPRASTLPSRVVYMALQALRFAVRSRGNLAAMRDGGLLNDMYGVALLPLDGPVVPSMPALLARLQCIDARAYEFYGLSKPPADVDDSVSFDVASPRVAAAGAASKAPSRAGSAAAAAPAARSGSGLTSPRAHAAAASALSTHGVKTQEERLAAATALAKSVGCYVGTADSALSHCDDDEAAARTLLTVHAKALGARVPGVATSASAKPLVPLDYFTGFALLPENTILALRLQAESMEVSVFQLPATVAAGSSAVTAAAVAAASPEARHKMLMEVLHDSATAAFVSHTDARWEAEAPAADAAASESLRFHIVTDLVKRVHAPRLSIGHVTLDVHAAGGSFAFDLKDALALWDRLKLDSARGLTKAGVVGIKSVPLLVDLSTSGHKGHRHTLAGPMALQGLDVTTGSSSGAGSLANALLDDSDLLSTEASAGGVGPSSSGKSKASAAAAGARGAKGKRPTAAAASSARMGVLLDPPVEVESLAASSAATDIGRMLSLESMPGSEVHAANRARWMETGVKSFEVLCVKRGVGSNKCYVGVAARKDISTASMAWGISNANTMILRGSESSTRCPLDFKAGDRIGVTVDSAAGTLTFTVNAPAGGGAASSTVIKDASGAWLPAITLGSPGDEFRLTASDPPGAGFQLGVRMHKSVQLTGTGTVGFGVKLNVSADSKESVTAVATHLLSALASKYSSKYASAVAAFEASERPSVVINHFVEAGASSAEAAELLASLESHIEPLQRKAVQDSLRRSGLLPGGDSRGLNYHGVASLPMGACISSDVTAVDSVTVGSRKVSAAAADTVVLGALSTIPGAIKLAHPTTALFASQQRVLDAAFTRFDAVVALPNDLEDKLSRALADPRDKKSGVFFTVAGDGGKELWRSKALVEGRQRDFCSVNVTGVKTLELRMHVIALSTRGDVPGAIRGVWMDAALRGTNRVLRLPGVIFALGKPASGGRLDVSPYMNAPRFASVVTETSAARGTRDADAFPVATLDSETGLLIKMSVLPSSAHRVVAVHGASVADPDSALTHLAATADASLRCAAIHAARATTEATLLALAAAATESSLRASGAGKRAASGGSSGPGITLDLEAAGGARRLLSLMKLAAFSDDDVITPLADVAGSSSGGAGAASSGASSGASGPVSVAEQLALEAAAIEDDGSAAGAGMAGGSSDSADITQRRHDNYGMCSLPNLRLIMRALLELDRSHSGSGAAGAVAGGATAAALVAECVRNFMQSSDGGAGDDGDDAAVVGIAQSLHPIPAHGVHTGVLELPPCESMALRFDPRCSLHGRFGEKLTLYSSADMSSDSKIGVYSGPSARLLKPTIERQLAEQGMTLWPKKPLTVTGRRVWWKLECRASRDLPFEDALQLQTAAGVETAPADVVPAAAGAASAATAAAPAPLAEDDPARYHLPGAAPDPDSLEALSTIGHTTSSWGFALTASASGGKWDSESSVLSSASTSVGWACYLLNFLLNSVLEILAPGALHNQQMVDALLNFLGTVEAGQRMRMFAVELVTQLLSQPHMFSAGISLSALSMVEPLVMDWVAKQRGTGAAAAKAALAPALQSLIELVVARRAVLRVHERAGAGPLLRSAGAAAAAGAASAGKADVALGAAPTSSTLAALLADFDHPLEPKTLQADPDKGTILESLCMVEELSAALTSGRRPRDEIMCSAWLAAAGECRTITLQGSAAASSATSGEVCIDGASKLNVHFNPCSALAAGYSLRITYGTTAKTFNGGRTIDDAGNPLSAGEAGAAASDGAGNWPAEPLEVLGNRLRWALVVPAGGKASDAGWGFEFSVTPVATPTKTAREAMLRACAKDVAALAKEAVALWSSPVRSHDLAALAALRCEQHNSAREGGGARMTTATMPLHLLAFRSENERLRFSSLVGVPPAHLRYRFGLMRLYNTMLNACLNCWNLASTQPWSVGTRLRQLTYAVSMDSKKATLDAALAATNGSSDAGEISLSNFKASESYARGELFPETSNCMFVQAYKQLNAKSSSALRHVRDTSQSKVFGVRFEGESGIDAGGVYREGLARMLDDAFSSRFGLLIECPNARNKIGINMSSYVPNPTLRTPLAYSMLEFLGRLMGISLRTRASLPFVFPSIVWKGLLGERGAAEDIAQMDIAAYNELSGMLTCEVTHDVTTEEAFALKFPGRTFTIIDSTGAIVPLVTNGAEIPVTFANRARYVELAFAHRLHEFDSHIAAIRRGLANVVPVRALALCTWQEVEVLVCGRAEIDVAVLRRNTIYESPYHATHKVVQSFWRVFTKFTHEERAQYMRFVWGRSRIPADGAWTSKHKITHMGASSRGADATLPHAHTCFCSVDIPEYSSDAKLERMLRIAMEYSVGGILNG